MSKEMIAKKAEIVKNIADMFKNSVSNMVVDYRGLTVAEVTELRKELREAGVEMRVIKNTYLKRAVKEANIEGMDDIFAGPTAVAFSNDDVTAPARILVKFAEDHEALKVKGGMVEGKVSSLDEINSLAKLPNREGLLSMLVSVLQAPIRNFAYAVKAVADSKEENVGNEDAE